MNKRAFNPYLPPWEFVPDGEPHVFGDRLYLFGSHDKSKGLVYCQKDYVCWSAPIDDLSDWACSGIIHRRKQNPHYKNSLLHYLYAPDVTHGPDGRYYLFYSLSFLPWISVAVCDVPDGTYEYIGDVNLKSDKKDYMPFDPGVLTDDDGRVWLYFGSCFDNKSNPNNEHYQGAMCVELAPDMLTILGDPKPIVPNYSHAQGSGFEDHVFFEASSMRKINGTYYFIYSSLLGHELCYATCDTPNGNFKYGGVLHSNCDAGLYGRTVENGTNYYANNHGSIVEANGQWYVFGHRHTQKKQYSRQGIAEKIDIQPDGTIRQAELTSYGLAGKPFEARGLFPAYIACNLIGKNGAHLRGLLTGLKSDEPRVDQKGKESKAESFISHFADGSVAGYKYFNFAQGELTFSVTVKGNFKGTLSLSLLEQEKCKTDLPLHDMITKDYSIQITSSSSWKTYTTTISEAGTKALFLSAIGKGRMCIKDFAFQ